MTSAKSGETMTDVVLTIIELIKIKMIIIIGLIIIQTVEAVRP